MARLGGNVSMLVGIVQSFAQDLPQVPRRLEDGLATGAQQEVVRTLHTLKGLASTVGARHLAHVAGDLEARCKAGLSPSERIDCVAQLQAAVDASLGSLADALARYPGAASLAVAGAELKDAGFQAAVRALADLLAQDDMQALEAYAALRNAYAPVLGTALDPLDQAMTGLEFEEALACCRGLLAS